MTDPARYTYRTHLVRLVARSEAAATQLSTIPADRRAEIAEQSRRDAARWSARLDASPLEDRTAAEVDADEEGHRPGSARWSRSDPVRAQPPAAGGWATALKLDGMPTADVAAVEYANLLACHDLERRLAGDFFAAPLATLTTLHGALVQGLVDPDRIGRIRETEQDVHDGAQGKVIFRTPHPARLPGLLESLLSWIGRGSAGTPALVVAGVVHGHLLHWQAFEAANGRLARSAARTVLRARGVDPDGLAVPERVLIGDPLAYFGEVAASIRRRGDLTPWIERTGEAIVTALEDVADAALGAPPAPPGRATEIAATLAPDERIDLADYADRAGVDRDTAACDLEALRRGRWLAFDPGTQGLRFRGI